MIERRSLRDLSHVIVSEEDRANFLEDMREGVIMVKPNENGENEVWLCEDSSSFRVNLDDGLIETNDEITPVTETFLQLCREAAAGLISLEPESV